MNQIQQLHHLHGLDMKFGTEYGCMAPTDHIQAQKKLTLVTSTAEY